MRWLTFESSNDAFRDACLLGAPLCRALGRRPLRPRAADQPPLPSALAQAALEGDLAGKVHVLASPKDGLAAALARLGRAFMSRNS
jgi:hypothetical protein